MGDNATPGLPFAHGVLLFSLLTLGVALWAVIVRLLVWWL